MEYAIVTGASSGIGLEFCKLLAKKGNNLVMIAQNKEELKKAAEEIRKENKIEIVIIATDLAKIESAQKVYGEIKKLNIEVSTLINNAGFGVYGNYTETDWNKEEQMIILHIITLSHLTKLFLQEMIMRKKGKILNVASTAAFLPGPLMVVYYATKAYVLSFTSGLANELKGTGVSCTALCPGATSTHFSENAKMGESKLFKNKLATPKEVAEFGYEQMMKGKTIAIKGFNNKYQAFIGRILPVDYVASLVRKAQEKK